MRVLCLILICAPLALATETIDGTNPPNPAKFDWDAGSKTATLIDNLSEGVVITGAGVTLDGAKAAGWMITGPGAGRGVLVGAADVKVLNCNVANFHTGIEVAGGTGIVVEACEVTGSIADLPTTSVDGDGIFVTSAPGVLLKDNVSSNNGQRGILVQFSPGAILDGNRVESNVDTGIAVVNGPSEVRNSHAIGNGGNGIRLFSQAGSTVAFNELHGNALSGLALTSEALTASCVIDRNHATGNVDGISFVGSGHVVVGNRTCMNSRFGIVGFFSEDCRVEDNDADFNATGINMSGTVRITIIHNRANDNTGSGIAVTGSAHVVNDNCVHRSGGWGMACQNGSSLLVEGNTVTTSGGTYGLLLSGVSNSTISSNTVDDNWAIGIALESAASSGNLLEWNSASRNKSDGFRLAGSSSVVRNNTAAENDGEGFQCAFGTDFAIEDNSATGNKGGGIVLAGASTADRNELTGNGAGISANGAGNSVLDNVITGSTVGWGVRVSGGSDTEVAGNTITGSAGDGILLGIGSVRTTATRNTSSGNGTGIRLESGVADSVLYDNEFRNATNASIHASATNNAWNVAATGGPNIVGGPSIGGNFWGSVPAGTGFSETGTDADGDGFCDQPFVIGANNVDNLPLVLNTAPSCNPSGAGVYELGSTITLGGTVVDSEGDLVTFEWRHGTTVLFSGSVQTVVGGAPVDLPSFSPALGLGVHSLALVVDDAHVLDPVECDVIVEVIDTTDPTLAPESDCSILWPPNHRMVTCTIHANASDNDGGPPTLDVTVASNEPDNGTGDGDTENDIQNLAWDDATGVITVDLRAERSGGGDGRVYTITITATDGVGNSSMAEVTVLVPHNKGKKN